MYKNLSRLLLEKKPVAYFGRYCKGGRFAGWFEVGYITETNGIRIEHILSRSR